MIAALVCKILVSAPYEALRPHLALLSELIVVGRGRLPQWLAKPSDIAAAAEYVATTEFPIAAKSRTPRRAESQRSFRQCCQGDQDVSGKGQNKSGVDPIGGRSTPE